MGYWFLIITMITQDINMVSSSKKSQKKKMIYQSQKAPKGLTQPPVGYLEPSVKLVEHTIEIIYLTYHIIFPFRESLTIQD